MKYIKFCDKCESMMDIMNNSYTCTNCSNTIKINNNTIVYNIDLMRGNNKCFTMNDLNRHDIYKKKRLSKCVKCNNNVYNMVSNIYLETLYICVECNTVLSKQKIEIKKTKDV